MYVDPLTPCDLLPEVPDERLPSFTAVKSLHKKEFKKKTEYGTFELTAVRAAKYVVANREHLLQLDDGGIMAAVASAPGRDLNQAGQRGTSIHLLLEALIKGHELDRKWVAIYAPAALDYVDAIEAWWQDQRPEAELAETVGYNWEHRYACTADVIGMRMRSYPDQILAVDFKTRGVDSNHGCYAEEGQQLAAAAFSEYVVVDRGDGVIVRRQPPKCTLGVIVSIKPDSVEMYPVDLAQAWEAWKLTCAGWRLRQEAASLGNKATSNKPTFVQPAPLPVTDQSEETAPAATGAPVQESATPVAVSSDAFAGLPDEDGKPQVDRAKMATLLRERILGLSDDGKKVLSNVWPQGLMTFGAARKQDPEIWFELYTVADLRTIEDAIAKAERASGASFPEESTEPCVPGDSALVVELARRWAALPPNRQPVLPAGMAAGLASVRQCDDLATALATAEEALHTAVENYRQGARALVVTPESTNGDKLKAGRAAAKALMLPPPRKAPDVEADPIIWRAAS